MEVKEIRTSIKTVYGMLWDVLALYEKTDCYNKVPEGEMEADIWDYMGDKLLEVRKAVDMLFLGENIVKAKLIGIIDETDADCRPKRTFVPYSADT